MFRAVQVLAPSQSPHSAEPRASAIAALPDATSVVSGWLMGQNEARTLVLHEMGIGSGEAEAA